MAYGKTLTAHTAQRSTRRGGILTVTYRFAFRLVFFGDPQIQLLSGPKKKKKYVSATINQIFNFAG